MYHIHVTEGHSRRLFISSSDHSRSGSRGQHGVWTEWRAAKDEGSSDDSEYDNVESRKVKSYYRLRPHSWYACSASLQFLSHEMIQNVSTLQIGMPFCLMKVCCPLYVCRKSHG